MTTYRVDTVLDTTFTTYSAIATVDGRIEKINFLSISKIDASANQVFLDCLDPESDLTIEKCKELGIQHKIVMIQKNDEKPIFFGLSEKLREEIPTSEIKLFLNTINGVHALSNLCNPTFLNPEKYAALAKGFTPIFRLILGHINRKNDAAATKQDKCVIC